jgi:hypothetical protein
MTPLDRLNIDDSHIGLDGYSPVSYVDLGRPEKGRAEFSAEHAGVKYYFTDQQQHQ